MRGRSRAWSISRDGAKVRFYGAADEKIVDASAPCDFVLKAIREEMPRATVTRYLTERGGSVFAFIDADEIAALRGGAAHRKAIGKLRALMSRLLNDTNW